MVVDNSSWDVGGANLLRNWIKHQRIPAPSLAKKIGLPRSIVERFYRGENVEAVLDRVFQTYVYDCRNFPKYLNRNLYLKG